MSLLGKPIEEVIETLYNSIKSKRQIVNNIKNEYNINNDNLNEIKINRLKLIDLLDEFEVTISQSLQAIQTLKVEIFNIKEKQTTEEILNLTNEFQNKYNTNNNNILDKLEYSKTENSIIEPNNNNEKNKFQNNNVNNIPNINSNKINEINNNNNYIKDINIITEAKLNFDYSSLLNNSTQSIKNSLSNLDKYRINYNQENKNINNNNNNIENKNVLNNNKNNEKDLDNNNTNDKININAEKNKEQINNINNNTNNINNIININDISNIKLKEEEIEEDQPSKLNINITTANTEAFTKANYQKNNTLRQNISYLSENNIIKYNNKFNSSRQNDINNNINDKTFNNYNNLYNNYDNLFGLDNSEEKIPMHDIDKINKSNDDINNKKPINIGGKNFNENNNNINNNNFGIDEYSIKGDTNNDMQYNFDESDVFSIVSKKDILIEKLKKIEEEEKFNKLIEEILSVKAFKLYILDKFGNGRFDTFIKRYKNGEINKNELESELNILKELSTKNNKTNNTISIRNNRNIHSNKKFMNRNSNNQNNNNNMNNSMKNNNNINSMNSTYKYSTENNFGKNTKYKKISNDKITRNINKNKSNYKSNNIHKNEYNDPYNFKNTLRESNRTSSFMQNSTFSNQNKIVSHSVNSIRARLKSKKF